MRPVELDGWDNQTLWLGDLLTVRLPSATGYVAAVEKEQRWLPPPAPHPAADPGAGRGRAPGVRLPVPWSVNPWLEGGTVLHGWIDVEKLAETLAGFLTALHQVDATDGPAAGPHSFVREGALSTTKKAPARSGHLGTASTATLRPRTGTRV